jgi:hypothetical protein
MCETDLWCHFYASKETTRMIDETTQIDDQDNQIKMKPMCFENTFTASNSLNMNNLSINETRL